MAIEEVSCTSWSLWPENLTYGQEFSIEIPDKEADAIHSGMSSSSLHRRPNTDDSIVKQAVDYILAQPDGKNAENKRFCSIKS